jgi:hypothetical protein
MEQESGQKRAGAVDLQPTLAKPDRVLVRHVVCAGVCPCCGSPVHRIQRRSFDRFVNFFMPVHRYRCASINCSWEGNLPVQRESPLK